MSKTEISDKLHALNSSQAHDAENNSARPCLLSPRSNNLQERKNQNPKLEKIRGKESTMEVSGVETKSKENVADNKDEKEEKKVQSAPNTRPPTMRKRSYSFSDGSMKHPTLPLAKRWKTGPGGRGGSGRGRGAGPSTRPGMGPPGAKNVLPSKFLLGGNINDPLNLNSLNDERIARVANAVTPESSPVPTPVHRKEEYKIEVLIPPNISDPLNLNADDDSDYESKLISPLVKRKKIRHRKRPRKIALSSELPTAGDEVKPEVEEGHEGDISDSEEEEAVSVGVKTDNNQHETKEVETAAVHEAVKTSASKSQKENKGEKTQDSCEFKTKNEKFQYGNYNQYYGYRNPGNIEDLRLQYFKSVWFEDKDVLDIGCNIGHITISIGKNFSPLKVVGIDIDKKLIQIANKNIKHYMDIRSEDGTKYPRAKQHRKRSFPTCLGSSKPSSSADSRPISPQNQQSKKFPDNVTFVHGNFVLECDELLENVVPEYDTILLLSTTKWIHLNFGDEGIKRVFKRIHAQLRPGGKFILEAQHFSTYKKKKKLTETIFNHFKNIKLKPENFSDYLLHEVGFSRSEVVALPSHQAKGFQRPLQIFMKPLQSSNISTNTTPYSFGISPHFYNPSFTPFYGKVTPGYTPRPGLDSLATPGYSGPTPPLYYGPTPGAYSANSTPNPAGFTPSYTPSYTPAHPGSPNYSPSYSPSYNPATPGTPGYSNSPSGTPHHTPGYSPSGTSPNPGAQYSPINPNAGYSPSGNSPNPGSYSPSGNSPNPGGYSPSGNSPNPGSYSPSGNSPNPGGYSPSGNSPNPGPGSYSPNTGPAGYSPSATPGYSPSGIGYSPSAQSPLYSPGNATPTYSGEPAYSPSIQGAEVTGNTTPHPDFSCSPSPSSSPLPAPRYSWAGGESGPGSAGNTPHYSHTPADTPVYEGAHSSGENTPQHGDNNEAETAEGEAGQSGQTQETEEAEAEICQGFGDETTSDKT